MSVSNRPSPSPSDGDQVLTLKEAAASELRCSERTLWEHLDEWPHFRIGSGIRFLRSELRNISRTVSIHASKSLSSSNARSAS